MWALCRGQRQRLTGADSWHSTTRRFGDGVLTLMAGERIRCFSALPEE
jgi:hypothetical protein